MIVRLSSFRRKKKLLFTILGQLVLGVTLRSPLSTVLKLEPLAVSKTSGTIFFFNQSRLT